MKFPKGDIMAFDVRTGRKLWTFHTIPRLASSARTLAERLDRVHGQHWGVDAVHHGRGAGLRLHPG